MTAVAAPSKLSFKNILFLTDFAEPSEAALPFAMEIAREFGAKIHAMNLMIPAAYTYTTPELTAVAIAAQEETAIAEMKKVDAQLAGLPHEVIVERATEIWGPVREALEENRIDLVVLGTSGRTGAQRLLLGSVAEEIFRRSPVPVLTIGPGVRRNAAGTAQLSRVLVATDFSPEAEAAVPFALLLASRENGRLVLLHVAPKPRGDASTDSSRAVFSAAETLHRLHGLVGDQAELKAAPEVLIDYGDAAERIVEAARQRQAGLIVLGIRRPTGVPGAATHLERPVAHKIVVHAPCPVLAIRR